MGGAETADLTLAEVIVDVTRVLSRSTPPPRGAPYFLLDGPGGYDLRVFDRLLARGIFRKYEFALDIGSGLGGRARWLAARSGCSVVGIDPTIPSVCAAAMLNRRAHMDGQVRFQPAHCDALPLRERIFTHVWMLDAVYDEGLPRRLAEACRVLRRGGHFALQGPPLPAERRVALCTSLSAAGFVDIHCSEVVLGEIPDTCRVALARVQGALRARPDGDALLARLPAPPRDPQRLQVVASRRT